MVIIPPQYETLSPAKVAKLLGVSRDSVTQQRRRDAGLCRYCEEPATDGMTVCQRHRTQRVNAARQRLGVHPWKAGGRGRPPKKADS